MGFYNVINYEEKMEGEGDLVAELLTITAELGGKMERLTCYNHDTTWKKIEIIYGKEDL
jgi:hypothetical protein